MNNIKLALENAQKVLKYTQTVQSNFDAELCAAMVEDALIDINRALNSLIDYEYITIKQFEQANPYKVTLPGERMWLKKFEVCIQFGDIENAQHCKKMIESLRHVPIAQSIEKALMESKND